MKDTLLSFGARQALLLRRIGFAHHSRRHKVPRRTALQSVDGPVLSPHRALHHGLHCPAPVAYQPRRAGHACVGGGVGHDAVVVAVALARRPAALSHGSLGGGLGQAPDAVPELRGPGGFTVGVCWTSHAGLRGHRGFVVAWLAWRACHTRFRNTLGIRSLWGSRRP